MKFIINILRFIIAFYLAALAIVTMIFYSNKKYNSGYPDVRGYSYYVIEDDKLESVNMPRDTFVVLQTEKNNYTAKEGDYVFYKDGEVFRLMQVKQENASDKELDSYLVGYPDSDESEYMKVKKMDVIAKYYYHHPTLTLCYKIFTNWIAILIMLLFLILSPSLTYKRFEL